MDVETELPFCFTEKAAGRKQNNEIQTLIQYFGSEHSGNALHSRAEESDFEGT